MNEGDLEQPSKDPYREALEGFVHALKRESDRMHRRYPDLVESAQRYEEAAIRAGEKAMTRLMKEFHSGRLSDRFGEMARTEGLEFENPLPSQLIPLFLKFGIEEAKRSKEDAMQEVDSIRRAAEVDRMMLQILDPILLQAHTRLSDADDASKPSEDEESTELEKGPLRAPELPGESSR